MMQEEKSGEILVGAWERRAYLLALGLLLLARAPLMSGPIDEPSWRQAWAAQQSRAFSRESPPEWLHAKVNFRGALDVSVWNLPLYEDVVGLLYKAFGERESLGRLVSLASFLGASAYLWLIVRRLFHERAAWLSACVYLALPLSVFYSRAFYYDFTLIFLSHAFFYHGLRFFDRWRVGDFALAAVSGGIAYAMKAPYPAVFGFPLLLAAWRCGRGRLPGLAALAGLHILPLAGVYGMHAFRVALEGRFERTAVFSDPYTKDYVSNWFFGTLQDRLDAGKWRVVIKRLLWEVATPAGLLAAMLGLLSPSRRGAADGRGLLWMWTFGVAAYFALFFRVIASPHDYYAIPALAVTAVWIALFACFVLERRDEAAWLGPVRLAALLGLVCAGSAVTLGRGPYFTWDWQRIEAGQLIGAHSRPDELVVAAVKGRSTGWTDPRLLYFADRRGWSASLDEIDDARLQRYREAGASKLAILFTPDFELDARAQSMLRRFPGEAFAIEHDGATLGRLWLFDVKEDPGPAASGGAAKPPHEEAVLPERQER
jgi:hypothetical protein